MAMQNLLVEFAESDKAVDRFDLGETDHILSIVHNRAHIVFNVSTCGPKFIDKSNTSVALVERI